jgi:predicted nucleotidyltransferase
MEESRTVNEFAPYVAALVRRERARRRRMREQATQALEAARAAADLLRRRYGATRVRLFGSVLYPERFHEHSDVDLAVEGLVPLDYLSAWALVNGADSEFEMDLIDPRDCSPYIWEAVEREGVDV